MTKLGTVAVSFLFAGCLAIGQAQPPNASHQAASATADQHSQTDNGTGEVPMFRAHARQVLVTASVRKNAAKSVPEEVLKRHPGQKDVFAVRPAAQGLSSNDFRIFDNGAEQRINYLEEFDSSWRDINGQWAFYPHVRGVWGNFLSFALEKASAIYVIGYVPPPLQSGDCHTIRVVAGDNEVVLNRSGYCNTDEDSTATGDGGKLAVQMEDFAKSGKRGSINVMSRAFVFWSSGVLSLRGDKSRHDVGSVSGSALNSSSYVVTVHDPKAPATVQIATEYRLERRFWDYPCAKNHPAVSVLGVVYKASGEVAARFGDRYSCVQRGYYPTGFEPPPGAKAGTIQIPSRFNTAVELRPGDYVVHVVVSDGHNFGQEQMPLRVEAIASQALALSDIAANGILRDASSLLRDAAMVSPLALVPAPLVSKQTQFIPVPEERIWKSSSLPLYFEVYDPLLADRNPEVYFRMKITNLKDGVEELSAGPMSVANFVIPGNVVVPIALNVDTGKLRSGAYRIEIQASDSMGQAAEGRSAKFEIQ
jgi:hypothetical protein